MSTPIKKEPKYIINEMARPQTPPLSFSRELRQVLQERNLLTAKTCKKVCNMLDTSTLTQSPSMDNSQSKSSKRQNFRIQAISEILHSENSYLKQLEILMEYFIRPLQQKPILSNIHHMKLFGQVEMIYNLNSEFRNQLNDNMENVASAFLKMAPFFKLYSVYAFDYKNALFLVEELYSKNPVFRRFIENTESRPEVQSKLNALMIAPIQRIPRYRLLLEQVLQYTSPADKDYSLLKESIKTIESIASHINTCIEDQEVTEKLISIQNSLVNRTPNIVKPSRKVIKEGVLFKITRDGSEIKRYCILMSDIFMYCKLLKERTSTVVENSLECCCIFPLKKCKVFELFPGTFKLSCQQDGMILGAKDLSVCNDWVNVLRNSIFAHVECRRTLRKESSKRKPMRKKDVKNFEIEFMLSPKRKCDYENIFRNRNYISESDDETSSERTKIGCFPRKKVRDELKMPFQSTAENESTRSVLKSKTLKTLKRPAPPIPTNTRILEPIIPLKLRKINEKEKKLQTKNSVISKGVTANDKIISAEHRARMNKLERQDVNDVLYTMIKKRETNLNLANDVGCNVKDTKFPIHVPGRCVHDLGYSTQKWQNPKYECPIYDVPGRKRVQFNDVQNVSYEPHALNLDVLQEPQQTGQVKKIVHDVRNNNQQHRVPTLRDRFFSFFTNLF